MTAPAARSPSALITAGSAGISVDLASTSGGAITVPDMWSRPATRWRARSVAEREPGSVFPSTAITWRAGEGGAGPGVQTQVPVQGGGDAGDEFPQGGFVGGRSQREFVQVLVGESGCPLAGGGEAPAAGHRRRDRDQKHPRHGVTLASGLAGVGDPGQMIGQSGIR